MMTGQSNQITQGQALFLIVQTQMGIGVLSLPYTIQKHAGRDGWISILVAGLFVQLLLFVYYALNRRFPKLTFPEIVQKLLGKYAGSAISILYSIYFLLVSSSTLLSFARIMNTWYYPTTPSWVIVGIVIVLGVYLVLDGLRTIARFYTLISVMIVIVIGLILWTYTDVNFLYLLPIGKAGLEKILYSAESTVVSSLLGFELVLFIFPLIQGSNRGKLKVASLANLIVTLFYTFIVISSLVFFSPEEIKLVPEPVLYMLKAQTTTIFERVDYLFMAVWVLFMSTTYFSYLYLSSKGVSVLFTKKTKNSYKPIVMIIALLTFVLGIWSKNTFFIDHVGQLLGKIGNIFIILIPLVLLIISLVKKKGRR